MPGWDGRVLDHADDHLFERGPFVECINDRRLTIGPSGEGIHEALLSYMTTLWSMAPPCCLYAGWPRAAVDQLSTTPLRATLPPSGSPPPTPFAVVTMSGTIPSYSNAPILPVRPPPLWISSAISTMPCRSHSARSPSRKPDGGTM